MQEYGHTTTTTTTADAGFLFLLFSLCRVFGTIALNQRLVQFDARRLLSERVAEGAAAAPASATTQRPYPAQSPLRASGPQAGEHAHDAERSLVGGAHAVSSDAG